MKDKKVIAFSLWGEKPMYTIGAIRNAEISPEIYPGWICRFYIGQSTPKEVIDKLSDFEHVEVVLMPEEGNSIGMFWRFLAASDPEVSVVISRDTDSRLNEREKLAVDEWMASNKIFHIMRDHPAHGVPILGGMWGVKNPILRRMSKMIEGFKKEDRYQIDQDFLRLEIFPLIQDKCIVHDVFFENKPWPKQREGYQFVGEPFDENENPNELFRSQIKESGK
jgi:protein O-GlcNAc transferase